jgi:hypothetical protein
VAAVVGHVSGSDGSNLTAAEVNGETIGQDLLSN